jgi:uncharacterized protein YlxW (UPF0749 family)
LSAEEEGIPIGRVPSEYATVILRHLQGTEYYNATIVAKLDDGWQVRVHLETKEERLALIARNEGQREARLEAENLRLENARETLLGGDEYAALNEAKRRADALGVLAGSETVVGSGIEIGISGNLSAATLIDAIQELRDAGAIAIQISDRGLAVRLVASSWFADSDSGITVSGTALQVPITISVIGDPSVLGPAMEIPGGLVDTVGSGGGVTTISESDNVDISAIVPLPNS